MPRGSPLHFGKHPHEKCSGSLSGGQDHSQTLVFHAVKIKKKQKAARSFNLASITKPAVRAAFTSWLHQASACCPTLQSTPATSGGRRCNHHPLCAAGYVRRQSRES